MRESTVHPAAYLPVNIGERTRFDAHGQHFLVGYHSRNTYWLSTDPPGSRRRWGTRRQIVEDIAYVLENGALPPASPRSMWEARRYSVPPEPPHHFVVALEGIKILFRAPDTLALYGVPYEMRPGQQPGDLWRAGNTRGWIWLGSPGWWGDMDRQERAAVETFLARHRDAIPQNPYEWARIAEFAVGRTAHLEESFGVADFDGLDDLIDHARSLGATHVLIAGAHTRLFFPRSGQYPYEEARVWRENRYWHTEGPGARRGIHQLPQGAAPLDAPISHQRYTAEAHRGAAETMETLAWEADDLVEQSRRLTRSTARPGTPVRVADPDSMYRGMTGTVVGPRADRVARLDNYSKRYLRGEGAVLVETQRGELFVIHARALEHLGTAIARAMARDSRRGPRRRR